MKTSDLINAINWNALGYGDVGELLNRLTSQNTEIAQQAYLIIETTIILGNLHVEDTDRGIGLDKILSTDIYQHLVPIFISLLDAEYILHKENLLVLLHGIACYKHYADGTNENKAFASQLHAMVWGGLPKYLKILHTGTNKEKHAVAMLLEQYSSNVKLLTPILLNAIRKDTDDRIKAKLTWTVHVLNAEKGTESFIELLKSYVHQDTYPLLSVTSSLCLVQILKQQAPKVAKDYVVELQNSIFSMPFESLPPGYESVHKTMKILK